jgi:hypothetical protein
VLLDPNRIPKSDKAILAGLYLSRFDQLGLRRLGFDSFAEAFNVLGFAVDSPRGSIKNYRDEFDPLFSNPRKGWHKRPRRENCLRIFEEYRSLDLELFTALIKSFGGHDENEGSEALYADGEPDRDSQFARRLITGLAAERYFEKVHSGLPEFQGCTAENTTQLGCGYDFRLKTERSEGFLAVEVKGLKGRAGNLSLTPREHGAAGVLGDRFFLFVVKNFEEDPFHEIFRNPLSGILSFKRVERNIVQTSWLTNL